MYIETTMPSGEEAAQLDPFTVQSKPPSQLVSDSGIYKPGWFFGFPELPNWEQSKAPNHRLQYWIHLHCETDTFYVSANIAHMGTVGNVSVFFIDKATKKMVHRSTKRWLWRNKIKQAGGCGMIWDPVSGSSIFQDRLGAVECSIHVEGIHIHGSASPSMGPPFVQSTPYQEGYGCLQWWGPLRFHGGDVTIDGISHSIPSDAMGGFDRTIGHRPRRQRWNWLCAHGVARNKDLAAQPFALQVAKDKVHNASGIDPKKFNLWFKGRLFKFDACTFTKERVWQIKATGNKGAESMTVTLDTQWTRSEKKGHPAFFGGRFNQHFGPLSGSLQVMGRTYEIHAPFALLEDSDLNL